MAKKKKRGSLFSKLIDAGTSIGKRAVEGAAESSRRNESKTKGGSRRKRENCGEC